MRAWSILTTVSKVLFALALLGLGWLIAQNGQYQLSSSPHHETVLNTRTGTVFIMDRAYPLRPVALGKHLRTVIQLDADTVSYEVLQDPR